MEQSHTWVVILSNPNYGYDYMDIFNEQWRTCGGPFNTPLGVYGNKLDATLGCYNYLKKNMLFEKWWDKYRDRLKYEKEIQNIEDLQNYFKFDYENNGLPGFFAKIIRVKKGELFNFSSYKNMGDSKNLYKFLDAILKGNNIEFEIDEDYDRYYLNFLH